MGMLHDVHRVYHVARSDFLERSRRFGFLAVLALTIVAAHVAIPAANAPYLTVALGGHRDPNFLFVDGYRGLYNSAWVGMQTAVVAALWLSLAGFYLVRGGVTRDLATAVGDIIATTPLRSPIYTLGKFLSNLAVFAVMIAFLVLGAAAIQLARGEELRLDPWALSSPFLLITLPAVALVAALAVLFECLSWLRGSFGSVVYFFLWVTGVSALSGGPDWMGVSLPLAQLMTAGRDHVPGFHGNLQLGGTFPVGHVHTFPWNGLAWTPEAVGGRLLWVGVAIGIALAAGLVFTRFDPARSSLRLLPERRPPTSAVRAASPARAARLVLTPLGSASTALQPGRLLVGELRLLIASLPWWWHLVALVLIAATLVVPFTTARTVLYPLAWLWPLLAWSAIGTQESRHGTEQIVFSTPHSLVRQPPMQWLAGVLVAIALASGMGTRFLLAGQMGGLVALVIAALLIPAGALAAGVWTGNTRLFELIYLALWYGGPWQHIASIDYMGTTADALAIQAPGLLLAGTPLLLLFALLGRKRQLLA